MKLLFVADGRSPITVNWLSHLVDSGHAVHLVSSYPCAPELELASVHVLPVAFGALAGETPALPTDGMLGLPAQARRLARNIIPTGLRTRIRQWFGPFSLSKAAAELVQIQREIQPDLVHAMRIPYEGMLAAVADLSAPLVISVWGNDFTLHAPSTPLTRRYTRLALQRACALHVDCHRDLRLAREWGFATEKPAIVLPTSGGIQPDIFYPSDHENTLTVINPRGFRAYVRNDSFFHAIPIVLKRHPQAMFLCPAMEAEARALQWVAEMKIEGSVQLLPRQSRAQMADLFRRSHVVVSPTTHDGTPNTLLEAMACGCFPVAGDLESLREWISPGMNGLLVDPGDPQALADSICLALEDPALRQRAAEHNARLIADRAEYEKVMAAAVKFYQDILNK
ncbi:MAG: glycosyltransferase family 4 protein [Anaerolineales bacterium]